jgi:hypothetical protein
VFPLNIIAGLHRVLSMICVAPCNKVLKALITKRYLEDSVYINRIKQSLMLIHQQDEEQDVFTVHKCEAFGSSSNTPFTQSLMLIYLVNPGNKEREF